MTMKCCEYGPRRLLGINYGSKKFYVSGPRFSPKKNEKSFANNN